MKKPFLLQSVSALTVFSLLDCRHKALGLVNTAVTDNKCRASNRLAVPTSKVDVWNNVIDVNYLAPKLHQESSRIGLGHKVFTRPRETETSNVIEETLDSILTELGDDSKYVEYWTRQEWRSIHAHADVDEYKAKEEQKTGKIGDESFRYPRNGHVLYLQVGSQVRGPTCVFPDRRSGGDLLRNIDTVSEGLDMDETSSSSNVELVTVPAVPGRLLRFQGDYLHAVPRPTDLWLLKFVKGSAKFEPEEEWGRSVILFNTWNDEPPLGLPIDEHSEPEIDSEESSHHKCNQKEKWSRVESVPSSPEQVGDQECQNPESSVSAKIWLLGDYRRRDYQMQTVKLEASESLRDALKQESSVMSTVLQIPS